MRRITDSNEPNKKAAVTEVPASEDVVSFLDVLSLLDAIPSDPVSLAPPIQYLQR